MMGPEKTFYQKLFRVPVAPAGTNIHKKQDDSTWLRPSETAPELDLGGDPYTHPYDQDRKKARKKKSSHKAHPDPLEQMDGEHAAEKKVEKRQASAVNQAGVSRLSG